MNINKGLDLSVTGEPAQAIDAPEHSPPIRTVGVLGRDYHSLRPAMKVAIGDKVKTGEALFADKRDQRILFTSPGSGTVTAINRGARRALQSIVIELDDDETWVELPATASDELAELEEANIRERLLESGAWTAIRTRPYSKVPLPEDQPAGIFVTAIDTNPLSADPQIIVEHYSQAWLDGLTIISKLTQGKVYVCKHADATLPESKVTHVETHSFSGKHPAGLAGTHIHHLLPVSEERQVWHLHYHDVIAIGKLFTGGRRFTDRIISLGGPMVKEPRLIRSRMGASTNEIVADQLNPGSARVIAGSVLGGFRAAGTSAFLGRFSLQVSVIPEGQPRQFLHWLNPFLKQFSVLNVFSNFLERSEPREFTSSQNGSPRAMVPLGTYEDVMPLDILPTQLLRALLVRDTETAKQLGALELDEDDLSLCTFVCHSKYEYGPALRACLEIIEREG